MAEDIDLTRTFDSSQSSHILTPNSTVVRWPAVGVALPNSRAISSWLVENLGAVDVWVAFDQDAVNGSTQYCIPPRTWKRLEVQTKSYISAAGGDGSNVICSPFSYEP